ncbi:MAG: hypothetical protein ACO30M_04065 [Candidatus Kapaibacteriota bacterium]
MNHYHSHIELHRDIIALKKAIFDAKHELEKLVHAHYTMREDDKQNLHDEYDKLFKHLEIEIQRKALLHSEIQRRAELLMTKHQRGEKLTPEVIDLINKVVDKEFSAIKSRIRALLEQTDSQSKQSHVQQDHASLSKLYKELAKKLHPDSGADPEHTKMYWLTVQKAYNSKDMHALHALHTLLCTDSPADTKHEFDGDFNVLQQEYEKLQGLIEKEKQSIQELKKQIPFCYELGLRDESWITKHAQTLQQQVKHFEVQINKANETIRMLTGKNWLLFQEELELHDASLKEKREYKEEFIDATYFSGRH